MSCLFLDDPEGRKEAALTELVVGRDAELATVRAALGAAGEGPLALLIEGEAGIGKTTLVRAAVADAEARGWRVLACAPAEAERSMSFAAVADLLGAVPDGVLDVLPPPQRHALDVALLRAEAGDAPADPHGVGAALLSVVSALARRAPIVLVVDDVQWVDGASARALEVACRRLRDQRVAVVAAARTPDVAGAPFGLEHSVPHGRRFHLTVGPLALAALHSLLLARHGTAVPRPLLVRIAEASAGNPFYALQIAEALVRSKESLTPGDTLPVPERLRALASARLARLPATTRAALLVVATAAHPTRALVDAALPASSDSALAPAERRGIVARDGNRLRFTHPLLASAVGSLASTEERRRVHNRLGAVVDDVEERARHLALGAEGPDEEVARLAEEAAGRARARGAAETAVELASHAQRLTPPDRVADRHRRAVLEADCRFQSGDVPGAETLLRDLAPSLPAGAERAQVLWRLGNMEMMRGQVFPARATLEEGVQQARQDTRLAAGIGLDTVYATVLGGEGAAAVRHASRALESAQAAGDDMLEREACAALAWAAFFDGDGIRRALLARATAGPVRADVMVLRRPNVISGILHMWADDPDEARARLEAERRVMIERGTDTHLPQFLWALVQIEMLTGDWEGAGRYADEGVNAGRVTAQEGPLGIMLAMRALLDAHRGRDAAARAGAEEGLASAERLGMPVNLMLSLHALGFLALSRGDLRAAEARFGRLCDFAAAFPTKDPSYGVRCIPDAIEVLIGLGRFDDAAALLGPFAAQADAVQRAWAIAGAARCRGLLAAARGDLDGALAALEASRAGFERLGYPFEHARTLLVIGQAHRRAKQKRAARDALGEALAVFERLGAPHWAERARAELARLGRRPAAPDELTATERRVAELAATGLTNREIGRAAFLNAKSVEGVLGRVYAKLGIRSRAELGVRMGTQGAGPERDEG